MADNGSFFHDTREPFLATDVAAVTLAATFKALYPAAAFPVLGGQYFARPGKRLRIRLFGRITTALTPGNLQFGVYYGTGADANGVQLAVSAVKALTASQTNLAWMAEIDVHCRTTGATGSLFCVGKADVHVGAIASTLAPILIPDSAPVVSGACDLTASQIISVQALRSGSTAETMQVHDLSVIAMN